MFSRPKGLIMEKLEQFTMNITTPEFVLLIYVVFSLLEFHTKICSLYILENSIFKFHLML